MIVASVISSLGSCELRGGSGLSLRVQIFDLGFTEDTDIQLAFSIIFLPQLSLSIPL
jgi:hypothetical protein